MIDIPIYPLIFRPQLRDYIWGGRNLEKLYGRQLPPGITAESWEISGHPNAATVVDNGVLRGQLLPDVLSKLGESLVGTRAKWALERGKFPLLIKLLDANKNLSVQVHPNDKYGLAHEGELGKTEMWYILHAEPGAQLIFGLKANVTADKFRQAIADNNLEDLLYYLPVKAGDAIFVEAGSVHALMQGTVVAEVQQNSDVTYRVYDWGRVGADGAPRPLHIEQALQVINFNQVEPQAYVPQIILRGDGVTRAEISRCDYFAVEKVEMSAGARWNGETDGQSMEIWGTVAGESELNVPHGETVHLPAIRFCLVPAVQGKFSVIAKTQSTMLRVYLP